ncbi:MAG: hypothetical protein JXO22_18165 [Phycisphaerae bacterium]|nr:hypothetical protein [Phycisphaerae bacterium]
MRIECQGGLGRLARLGGSFEVEGPETEGGGQRGGYPQHKNANVADESRRVAGSNRLWLPP